MKLVEAIEFHIADVYSKLYLKNEEHKINKHSNVEN
jgi:hypothetical protein